MRGIWLGMAGAAMVAFAGTGAAEAAKASPAPSLAVYATPVVQADWVYYHGRRHWRRPPPRRSYRHHYYRNYHHHYAR